MPTEILLSQKVQEIIGRQGEGTPHTERAIQMEQAAQLNRIAVVLEKIERLMSARAKADTVDYGPS